MNGLDARLPLVAVGAAIACVALYGSWVRLREQSCPRRLLLVVLRGLLLALVLGAVANPVMQVQSERRCRPLLTVALDASPSMGAPVRPGGPTRLALALRAVTQGPLANALAAATVERYLIGARAVAVERFGDQPPSVSGTDLQAALAQVLREPRARPPAACLLISDGADRTGRPPARVAEALGGYGVPVLCLGVGGEALADARVAGLVAPRTVVEGEQFQVRVLVRAASLRDRPLTLVIRRDGAQVHEQELPAGETERPARVSVQAGRPGYRRISAEVAAVEGELSAANNLRSTVVRVEPRAARVLLIEGRPRREYGFLRRLLLRIEDLEAVILLRKREPAEFWLDAGQPRRASLAAAGELSRYRAVILSNVEAAALGPAFVGSLSDFVMDGGALAMLGGESSFGAGGWGSSRLGAILPVRTGGGMLADPIAVRPTGEGEVARALRATGFTGWERLPLLEGMNEVAGVTPGAEVAMEGVAGSVVVGPLVVTSRAGEGRALAVMAADTWRWQQSPEADEHSRAGWEALWMTLIGWLIAPRAESQVLIELGRDSFEAGEPVRALIYVRDADYQPVVGAHVELTVSGPGSPSPAIEAAPTGTPGEYAASFLAGKAGAYEARARVRLPGGGALAGERRFDVTPPIGELTDPPRPEVLAAIAQETGGRYLPLERAREMAGLLPTEAVMEERRIEVHPARTVMFFLVLLALAAVDWLLRRRWGVG
ncbi:MAG: hypothetical protein AB7Y46_14530 [Armatimonadota bacterium]